ncbi:MAG: TetR/AcrR family transcriptional regulator [Bacteroidota bacterium]
MVKPVSKDDHKTEEKILEAAKDEFMKFGLYGARMQSIADTAGINKALLHYYYRSKENLFDKVFEGALKRYFDQMDVLEDEALSFKKRIFLYIDHLIDFLEEYPHVSLFIIKEVSVSPEMFKEKMYSTRKSRGKKLYILLEEEKAKKTIANIDTQMFIINMQSMCYYPFIASPLYKTIFNLSAKDWKDLSNVKLKKAVKNFVERTLNI